MYIHVEKNEDNRLLRNSTERAKEIHKLRVGCSLSPTSHRFEPYSTSSNMGHKAANPTHIVKCLPRMVSCQFLSNFLDQPDLFLPTPLELADESRLNLELVTCQLVQPVSAYLWTANCRY